MKKGPSVLLGCGLAEALKGPQAGCVDVLRESGQVKIRWGSAPDHTPGRQDKACSVEGG